MIKQILKRKDKEILGINRRNQNYIRPNNPLSAKRIADNKLLTKRVMAKIGIKTPDLYKVIRTKTQLRYLDWDSLPKSFVVKPNRGSTGSGIIVFFGKKKNHQEWIRPSGQTMNIEQISSHMEKILEGRFSMGNRSDVVIIEERVKNDNELKKYCYKGVPDIRLIIYNRVPVMAMIRLPTRVSDGKANLHAGGICAGIDIASGITTYAMHMKGNSILEDTYESLDMTIDLKENLPLRGIKIPFWDKILEIAVTCQDVSGLGYLGVDIVIDRDKGPMILELNARPGLGIQTANNAGIRQRLERVEGLKIKSVKHGIRVAKNLFGGEIEENIEILSGKQVVNLVEKVYLYHRVKKDRSEYVNGLLDTGILTSRIDRALASRIGFQGALKFFDGFEIPDKFESLDLAEEYITHHEVLLQEHPDIKRLAKIVESGNVVVRPVFDVEIKVTGVRKTVEAIVSTQTEMIYPFLLGRTELKDYLIDASKTFTK